MNLKFAAFVLATIVSPIVAYSNSHTVIDEILMTEVKQRFHINYKGVRDCSKAALLDKAVQKATEVQEKSGGKLSLVECVEVPGTYICKIEKDKVIGPEMQADCYFRVNDFSQYGAF